MDKELLLAKIAEAKKELSDATAHLEKVLSQVQVRPRAEKTSISAEAKDAFVKLHASRKALEELEILVVRELP